MNKQRDRQRQQPYGRRQHGEKPPKRAEERKKLAKIVVSVWLTAVMHYRRMQRRRDIPSSLWFQVTVLAVNAYVFSGNLTKREVCWELAAIVNDRKKERKWVSLCVSAGGRIGA